MTTSDSKNPVIDAARIEAELVRLLEDPEGKVVLLTGPWGSGKTYLWHNGIAPKLERLRPIYISMFGIGSAEAMKSAIATESIKQQLTFRTNEDVKSSLLNWLKLGKAALEKGVDAQTKVAVLAKHLDALSLVSENHVFCFDDLERMSEKTTLKEIIGLANLIAERKNGRVLLIANEEEFARHRADSVDTLERYRERVVSAEFMARPNIELIYDGFASEKSPSPEVAGDIKAAKGRLIEILTTDGKSNLRTLRRMLTKARELLVKVGRGAVKPAHVELLAALQKEYDEGRLQPANFYDFEPIVFMDRGGNPDEITGLRKAFVEKYFKGNADNYTFSRSIHAFVKNGYLGASAIGEFAPAPTVESPSSRLISKIRTWKFRFFSDSQLIDLAAEIEAFLKSSSECAAMDLLYVWNYYCHIKHLLGLDPLPEARAATKAEMLRLALAGDVSIDQIVRMHFSDFRKYCDELLATYESGQAVRVVSETKSAVATAIATTDWGVLVKLMNQPETLVGFLDDDLMQKIFDSWRVDREFHCHAVLALDEALRRFPPDIVPGIERGREIFLSNLLRLPDDSAFGHADKIRFGALFERAKRLLSTRNSK